MPPFEKRTHTETNEFAPLNSFLLEKILLQREFGVQESKPKFRGVNSYLLDWISFLKGFGAQERKQEVTNFGSLLQMAENLPRSCVAPCTIRKCVKASRKQAYIVLIALNPTFIQ